jgi:hypothetical protein
VSMSSPPAISKCTYRQHSVVVSSPPAISKCTYRQHSVARTLNSCHKIMNTLHPS